MKIEKIENGFRVALDEATSMEISDKTLITFIEAEDLNQMYIVDELITVCPVNLLKDNYHNVIELWVAKQEENYAV
ncbi:hypothetical protein [Mucilaginibacter sp.]|jgi:hypothetical protein|uniref:hypothetical protein n=1 Tax=Mucilaginibacter sp. TaxID=1882438 RepID=UPI003566BFD8